MLGKRFGHPHSSVISTIAITPLQAYDIANPAEAPTHTVEESHAHHRTDQIGVPADGIWNFVDAYEHRFCYHHEQNEWLLRAEDAWMLSDDFGIPGVRGKLDGQVNRFQNPSHPQPSLSKKQAECDSTLVASRYGH